MKRWMTALAAVCATLTLAGCGAKPVYARGERQPVDAGERVYMPEAEETYYNFIELFDGDGDVYDIGDPYVFRFDGKYYLYTSLNGSKKTTGKIPCWVSDDLVDWDWAGWAYGAGKPFNPETEIAFAPEVVYYQGWFYMCQSQRGNGHYFFRSKDPQGPFERITDNLGQNIDGSFYLADDGQLYFMSATVNGIAYMPVTVTESGDTASLTLGKATVVPEATLSNMWTEGPGWFERNGYRYLTFTGNHVDSAGYRVGYAYTQSDDLFDGLQKRENNVLLVSNGEDTQPITVGYGGNAVSAQVPFSNYRGTGHSSNVLGPDLDSIYTAYHTARRINYNNVQEGSERKYNLTRYFTNGSYVLTDSLRNFDVSKPKGADYSAGADELIERDGLLLSDFESDGVFTAELNFRATNGRATLYAGYLDEDDHTRITLAGGRLTAVKVTDGRERVLGAAKVELGSRPDAVHTVRVVSGAHRGELWFDNMKKLAFDGTLGRGRAGYGVDASPSSMHISLDAFGTADFDAVKNLTGAFPAFAYAKGENAGWRIAGARIDPEGVRQSEPESTLDLGDGRALKLEAGDWVKYNVRAPMQGWYDLTGCVSADSVGAVLEVIVDNKDIYRLDVDQTDFGSATYLDQSLGRFFIDKGVHTLKLRVFDGTLKVKNFRTEKQAQSIGEEVRPLTEKPDEAKTMIGYAYYDAAGMTVNEFVDRTMTYWGQRGMTDYRFSVDVQLTPRAVLSGSFGGGLLFRAKNYHYAANAKVSANLYGWQGYFLQLTNTGVTLYKCNFDGRVLARYDLPDGKTLFGDGDRKVTVGVKAYHGELEIALNGQTVIACVDDMDPWTTGYIGFYGTGSEMVCSELQYCEI